MRVGGSATVAKARLRVHGRSVARTSYRRMLHTMSCSSFATCCDTTTGPGVTTEGELPRSPHVAAMAVEVTVLEPTGAVPPSS